mgnify:CR=1 FL=1
MEQINLNAHWDRLLGEFYVTSQLVHLILNVGEELRTSKGVKQSQNFLRDLLSRREGDAMQRYIELSQSFLNREYIRLSDAAIHEPQTRTFNRTKFRSVKSILRAPRSCAR